MKKLLFTTLLTTVAVIGAVAQDLWLDGNTGAPDFICPGGEVTCSINYGAPSGTIVYEQAGTSGNQGPASILSNYNYEL